MFSGGGLVNNGFPALSADGSKIAIFYHAPHPMQDAYPTLDIYSTATLSLQKRIEFVPERGRGNALNLSDPQIVAHVQRRVQEVNRYLRDGGFRPKPKLFDFLQQRFYAPITNSGKCIEYVGRDGISVLVITSLATGDVELEVPMPTIPLDTGSEGFCNDCASQGGIDQGWYDPESRLLVLRMQFSGSTDGSELPEKWLLKRL